MVHAPVAQLAREVSEALAKDTNVMKKDICLGRCDEQNHAPVAQLDRASAF